MSGPSSATVSISGVRITVISQATGHRSRYNRRLLTLAKKRPTLHPMGAIKEMDVAMSASDVLVGKAGGLTVSEALAMGLPIVMFNPIPGQEKYNVGFLVNYGAGLWARDDDDVVEKVAFLSTHARRLAQIAENADMLGKPNAARAISERVLGSVS